jgi:hypothetical protein
MIEKLKKFERILQSKNIPEKEKQDIRFDVYTLVFGPIVDKIVEDAPFDEEARKTLNTLIELARESERASD